MRSFVFLLLFNTAMNGFAGDTMLTHPWYPPIVYENGEYNFYKYTPKYIPDNLLHCFKILGTVGEANLIRFSKRTRDEVIERGIFDRGYRIRKEFCLESYSPFTQYFHAHGIYSPHAMQTYILLSFHQYLRGEWIDWNQNKRDALKDLKAENKSWRKRAKHLFKSYEYNRSLEPETNPEVSEDDWFYAW
jgi:hypothetical protein